jgi:hypothetical protein
MQDLNSIDAVVRQTQSMVHFGPSYDRIIMDGRRRRASRATALPLAILGNQAKSESCSRHFSGAGDPSESRVQLLSEATICRPWGVAMGLRRWRGAPQIHGLPAPHSNL